MHPYDSEKWLRQIDDVIAGGPYKDDWSSLMEHSTPEWFRKGRFGIFIHWGVYSVPAYANEWYPRNMYIKGSREWKHHVETYGPMNQCGYKDLIPLFKAEHFDPEEWADLFVKAGARYVVPVAEHHDGFQMYESELSDWNASNMGPHRDVLGELSGALRRRGLVVGASSHRIEHWFFMSHGREFDSDVAQQADERTSLYWPAMPVADDEIEWNRQAAPCPTEEFLEDWMIRTVELIDRYHPAELYFDWWIMHAAATPYLKKIAAYYYNRAGQWGEEVLLINKMGAFMPGAAVRDMERGQFADTRPDAWQTDTAIARNSWCYTEGNDYKSPEGLVRDLIDCVSKNGCMLLNVGPRSDGTISGEDQHVLLSIGKWLSVNGEGIYESRPYDIFGEGPTRGGAGAFSDATDMEYTSSDYRFTIGHGRLYAFAMQPSGDGNYLIRSLARLPRPTQNDFNGIITAVEVPGSKSLPTWSQTPEGLRIQTDPPADGMPVCFRITLH